jgi:hypothetical protein
MLNKIYLLKWDIFKIVENYGLDRQIIISLICSLEIRDNNGTVEE